MENQKDLSPNLFQGAAANIQEEKEKSFSRCTAPDKLHSCCGGCIQVWADMQGLVTMGKQVSLVLLLMEQFVLTYKCFRKFDGC